MAHITLWTDESIPTLDFDVYLTGFDVQTINLRDVFLGDLPVTADHPRDPKDEISPTPGTPPVDPDDPAAGFGCTQLPFTNPVLDELLLEHITQAHTGGPSPLYGDRCSGADYGDNIARGYITIDDVNLCNFQLPSDPGYFGAGGTGIASNDNQLWGDFFYVDDGESFAQGEELVHIEAFTGEFPPGSYTFYGRYVGFTGIDEREPLPTTWAARYITGGLFDGGTDLIVWRDAKRLVGAPGAPNGPHTCGTTVSWAPLAQTQVIAFDEEENPVELCLRVGPPVSPAIDADRTCFPWETGRYHVGPVTNVPLADPLAPPFEFGWFYLNLNHTFEGDPAPGGIAQSWVMEIHSALGRFSVGYNSIHLDTACVPANVLLPVP